MSGVQRLSAGMVIGVALAVLGAACGDTATSSVEQAANKTPRSAIKRCLVRAGATRATEPSQVEFLLDAQQNEQVSNPGFAWDKKARLFLQIYEPVARQGRRPAWVVYTASRFEKDLTVEQVFREPPGDWYVLYVRRPSNRTISGLEKCVRFGIQQGKDAL